MKIIHSIVSLTLLLGCVGSHASETQLQYFNFQLSNVQVTDVGTGRSQPLKITKETGGVEVRFSRLVSGKERDYSNHYAPYDSPADALDLYINNLDYSFHAGTTSIGDIDGYGLNLSFLQNIPVEVFNNTQIQIILAGELDYDFSFGTDLQMSWQQEAEANLNGIRHKAAISYAVELRPNPPSHWDYSYTGAHYEGLNLSGTPEVWELPLSEGGTSRTIPADPSKRDLRFSVTITLTNPPAVPEPSSYALLGLGLGVVGFAARRRKAS